MRTFTAMLVLFFLYLPNASGQQKQQSFLSYGAGSQWSCARYISKNSKLQGDSWILGYWSGVNSVLSEVSGRGHTGSTSDADGIVAEVILYCRSNPSAMLAVATAEIMKKFLRDGR